VLLVVGLVPALVLAGVAVGVEPVIPSQCRSVNARENICQFNYKSTDAMSKQTSKHDSRLASQVTLENETLTKLQVDIPMVGR
jgi:hypothetical protein